MDTPVIELKNEAAQQGKAVATAIDAAIREARAFGTALVGDITNTFATSRPLKEHDMAAVVFHELLGFRSEDAASLMQEASSTPRRVSRRPISCATRSRRTRRTPCRRRCSA